MKPVLFAVTYISISSTLITSTLAVGSESYSLFKDYIDTVKVNENKGRVTKITRNNNNLVVAKYQYNESGKILKREYLDSTFSYKYDENRLIQVEGLINQNSDPSKIVVHHTNENFISDYHYNTTGRVTKEIKSVYNPLIESLAGSPDKKYKILFKYENNKLSEREFNLCLDNSCNEIIFDNLISYSYLNGKLSQISESNGDSLYLEYYDNGEISKAIQTKGGREVSYQFTYMNDNSIYGIYYVDPIKEWKVDMDFFSLSFSPIKTLKITQANGVSIYTFNNPDHDSTYPTLATQSNLTITSGDVSIERNYQLTNQ